ncbi:unnamed protein product [Rotaria magnacalcarata]|uniref:Uncharacterized protein n=1 Tax=Rotaria magnacalcarata TaxID=392030 RepID=A0A815K859_9BILA|nr:unnamed protein product [Rotaria magnacalcarata]
MAMHIIWPQNLALIATLRTLHERKSSTADTDFGKIKFRRWIRIFIDNKLIFFFTIGILSFIYEWFPLYIMPLLGYFSWMCMIRPQNSLLVHVTSTHGTVLGGDAVVLY